MMALVQDVGKRPCDVKTIDRTRKKLSQPALFKFQPSYVYGNVFTQKVGVC